MWGIDSQQVPHDNTSSSLTRGFSPELVFFIGGLRQDKTLLKIIDFLVKSFPVHETFEKKFNV